MAEGIEAIFGEVVSPFWRAGLRWGIRIDETDTALLRQMNVMGDREIPWDGQTVGELEVRGPWVAASYFDLPDQGHRWTTDG